MGTLCWRSYRVVFAYLLTIVGCSLFFLHPAGAQTPPYLPSPVISDMTLNWSTHNRQAPGSDNWPITWADDDHQYTAWGDGGGFGGTNSNGRVSLGVARVTGDKNNYKGKNVWGGKNPENPAQFKGKSYGILSVGGVLYMWLAFEKYSTIWLDNTRVAWSTNHGATWQKTSWAFTFSDGLTIPTFLNFGKNYAGARDTYVYSYYISPKWGPGKTSGSNVVSGFDVHQPGELFLSRVLQESILDQTGYEFFAGLDRSGAPIWTQDLSQKQPVFQDPNGVGWNVSVSYNAGIGRYLLMTEHTQTLKGFMGLHDAPEPWGPWTTVHYTDDFGRGAIAKTAFYWNFSNKWLSSDGKDFVMVFTGIKSNDSWNTVRGSFVLSDLTPPNPPTGVRFFSP